jgi:RNA polymerase sigma-70 factor, ECF subfamily
MAAELNRFAPGVTEVAVVDDLEGLFRSHYGRLVRALTVASGSREAAADAVQEAFVKAHLHWRKVRTYDDPVGWIRRVAINKLRDDHRRRTRKQHAEARLAAEPLAGDSSEVSVNEDRTAEWLAELPRQQRLALALFYVDELSVAEIAAALGISDGAVKFHLHQGRQRLRGIVDIAHVDE